MVLRFRHMLACVDRAKELINRSCRDLVGGREDKFDAFGKLKEQFYIMPNCDLFIDDDMDEECWGYILKSFRSIGLLAEQAEVIVPSKYMQLREADGNDDDQPQSGDSCDSNVVYFEDYLPDSYYDDGNFEAEMEEIENMNDEDDD